MATSKGPISGRWYPTLKEGLFKAIPRAEAGKLFIVQSFKKNKDGEYKRVYAAFVSSVDFYIFYYKLKEREHHEVIMGEVPQKPRIDIDLEIKNVPIEYKLNEYGDMIRDTVIESMLEVLSDLKTPLESLDNLVICTSHSKVKYSCHIILAGMMHYSCEEAREFFNMIVRKSAELGTLNLESVVNVGILDPGIYKSLQNFRLIGSGKRNGSGEIERIKTYQYRVVYKGSEITFPEVKTAIEEMKLFRKASITDTTACKHIPVIVPLKEKIRDNVILPDGAEVDIFAMVDFFDPGAFEIADAEGSLVALRRIRSSKCVICTQNNQEFCAKYGGVPEVRIHDNISPFVIVKENGDVLFFCRRSPKGKNFRNIGNIKGVQVTTPNKDTSLSHSSSPPGSPAGTPVDVNKFDIPPRAEPAESLDYIHNMSSLATEYSQKRRERDFAFDAREQERRSAAPVYKQGNEYHKLSFGGFSGKGSDVRPRTSTAQSNVGFSSFGLAFK